MEQGFIDILEKVVDEHGKEYFQETKKCKAIVSDYTGSDYRIERGMLLRAVEAGVSNAIITVEEGDFDSCIKVQQRKLQIVSERCGSGKRPCTAYSRQYVYAWARRTTRLCQSRRMLSQGGTTRI